MIYEEAIKRLKLYRSNFLSALRSEEQPFYGMKEFKIDSDALDTAIKALEQEPKQVEIEGDGYSHGTEEIVYDFGRCPNCGWRFEDGDKDWEEPYCCHCGQMLKWFDNKTESEE